MRTFELVMMTGIACGGCAGHATPEGGDVGDDEAADPSGGGSVVTTSAEVRDLACVSEATLEYGWTWERVWRASASIRSGAATVSLGSSPQFRSHAGVWSSEGESFTLDMVAREHNTSLSLESEAYPPTSIRLERDGSFFAGELERAGSVWSVLCWDRLELFGSAWAQRPSTLPAHFDPALGACVDAEGAPAENDLPIAFVRETNFGECADLSDVALNDDDIAYPDLALNLRGANLDGATLYFANLSASLEGARMQKFQFGYAKITGRVDASTELPVSSSCSVVESPWAGNQVTCVD